MSLKAIETRFDGHRFRSRTEARWAVFFKEMGWPYDYEKEGVVAHGEPYLPDFFIPSFRAFLEIKGVDPTEREIKLCRALSVGSGNVVLMAVGVPTQESNQFWYFAPDGTESAGLVLYGAADDERAAFLSDESYFFQRQLGSEEAPSSDLVITQRLEKAFEKATGARFEFGEIG